MICITSLASVSPGPSSHCSMSSSVPAQSRSVSGSSYESQLVVVSLEAMESYGRTSQLLICLNTIGFPPLHRTWSRQLSEL